jgi:hypothetical protein
MMILFSMLIITFAATSGVEVVSSFVIPQPSIHHRHRHRHRHCESFRMMMMMHNKTLSQFSHQQLSFNRMMLLVKVVQNHHHQILHQQ